MCPYHMLCTTDRYCHLFFLFFCVSVCTFFFFFFQAEDGIRDVAVTGVQTCALPISDLVPYRVEICLGFLTLLMLGNLRGIRESGRIFAVPTYVFVVSICTLIAVDRKSVV